MGASVLIGFSIFDSNAERATLLLAFGLSLSLFGLTTLEALSTELLLSHQDTLAFAYWISLWLLSIYIIFVVPGLVGASAAVSFGHYFCCTSSPSRADSEKYSLFDLRTLLWCIRIACRMGTRLIFMLFKNLFYNGRQRQNPNESSVLPICEESLVRTQSGDSHVSASPTMVPTRNKRSSANLSSPADRKHEHSPNHSTSRQQQLLAAIGGIFGIVLLIGLFSTIGPLVVQLPSIEEMSILSVLVSWICALGLLISSVLNGFGSVSLPYTTLSGFFLPQIRPDCMTKLEKELKSTREMLMEKQMMLKEVKLQIPMPSTTRSKYQSSLPGPSSKAFSMSSFMNQNNTKSSFSDIGVELKKRREILTAEIGFMEDLVRETTLDLEELKHSQKTAAAARTSIGKAKLYIGIFFSTILLIRLFNAGYSILRSYGTLLNSNYSHHRHKKARSDIVTSILIWLTGHRYFSHDQYNMLSQMVSLGLSAILSFTQVRTFLRTATIIHRRLSRLYNNFFGIGGCDNENGMRLSPGKNSDQKSNIKFLRWVISGLLGCYSLACIVLIKMMLPERFSVAFAKALDGTSIFTINSSAVNMVFFSSAVASSLILGMLLGIQRQNISKHANILSQRAPKGMGVSLPDV